MHSVTTIPISDDLSIGSNEYIVQPKKPENSVVKLISNVKLKKKENETYKYNFVFLKFKNIFSPLKL